MRICLALLISFLWSDLAHAQAFEVLDFPDDARLWGALGVSADGSIAWFFDGNGGLLRWSSEEGPADYESSLVRANNVSDDGLTVVGEVSTSAGFQAVRWTVDGGIQDLGNTGGATSEISGDTSADGGIVVGSTNAGGFRWSEAAGMDALRAAGGLVSATKVSADGQVASGIWKPNPLDPGQAFLWTAAAGFRDLGLLGSFGVQEFLISDDGTVATGSFITAEGSDLTIDPFRWTEAGGVEVLGRPGDPARVRLATVTAISGDGAVIVGYTSEFGGTSRATVWRAGDPVRYLRDLLQEAGADLTGWTLYGSGTGLNRAAPVLSQDGSTLAGTGLAPDRSLVNWRAVLSVAWAPAEDEIVPPGDPYTVRFPAPGDGAVDLYLVANSQGSEGTRALIAEGLSATDGTYEWEVPEDLLSPSTFLIAVDAADGTSEVVSERFRVRKPGQLHRVVGTVANPEYEAFRFAQHAFPFNQDDDVLWPSSYWDRSENAYEDNVFGYDPLIPPLGDVRYDEEWFSGRSPAAHPTWEAFARAFGFEGTYASTATTEFGPLTIHQVNPQAAGVWRQLTAYAPPTPAEGTGYNGVCYGYVMAVLAGFGTPDEFGARWLPSTGASSLAEVDVSDEVRDALHALYSYQFEQRHRVRVRQLTVTAPATPREVLAQLKGRFASDVRTLDRVLAFYASYEDLDGSPVSGGHAVVPVGVEDVLELGNGSELGVEGDGVYYTVILDPNYGPEPALIQIDSTASTWQHRRIDGSPSEWLGPNSGKLFLAGLAVDALGTAQPSWPVAFEESPAAPPVAQHAGADQRRADVLTVRVAGGDAALSGAAGIVRFQDGILTETLPGGGALFALTGRPSRPYAYVAPPGRYTVSLQPGPTGRSLLEVDDRRALGFERLGGVAGGAVDELGVGGDTLTVTPGQEGPVRVAARVTVEAASGAVTRTFTADSLASVTGQTVQVSALADSSSFRVASDAEVTYDLVLGQAGATGRRSFYHANVTLPAGASHVVQPDWTTLGDGPVTVAVDLDGDGEPDETLELANEGFPVASEDEVSTLPEAFALAAYPNPARGTATVEIALPEASDVRAEVYDLLGRRVATLHDGPLAAGTHPLALDAARLPAGVYVVRAVTPEATLTRRLTVVR